MKKILAVLAIVFAFVGNAEARNWSFGQGITPQGTTPTGTFNSMTATPIQAASITTSGYYVRIEMSWTVRQPVSQNQEAYVIELWRDSISGNPIWTSMNPFGSYSYPGDIDDNPGPSSMWSYSWIDRAPAGAHVYYLTIRTLHNRGVYQDGSSLIVEEMN